MGYTDAVIDSTLYHNRNSVRYLAGINSTPVGSLSVVESLNFTHSGSCRFTNRVKIQQSNLRQRLMCHL